MEKQGMVYLVGAGPGDPGLMTLKGRELLSSCSAVVYDHLASERFLDWVPDMCRKVYVGKQAGHHSMKQEEINDVLVDLALSGLTVVRLKGGDPFVFGRGGEEILALEANNVAYQVVPGVTSAVAVPECAGIPVTHRAVSRSFHVITGHTQEGEDCLPPGFETYAALPGTLVFLMGLGQLPFIAQKLMDGGKSPDTPAAVIEKGTLPDQRTIRGPLYAIHTMVREAGLSTPAIIVVGETASYEMRCSRHRPLSGVRVGITGTEHFADSLRRALEEKGAWVSWLLDMKVLSHVMDPPMQQAYRDIQNYSWIAFTSANGVRLFFEGLLQAGRDYRCLGHIRFAVIGDGTGRELASYGFHADYMPDSFCAQALATGLASILDHGDRLLIARSRGGSTVLTETLHRAGAVFEDVVLYEVSGSQISDDKAQPSYDYLTFASASGVRAFLDSGLSGLIEQDRPGPKEQGMPGPAERDRFGPAEQDRPGAKLVCIGDITAGELERHGMKAHITAGSYHISGLVQAITEDVIASGRS